MNKQKGYIGEGLQVILGIGLIIAVIATTIYLTNRHTDNAILQAIQSGADPLAARCAFNSSRGTSECIISAMNNSNKKP